MIKELTILPNQRQARILLVDDDKVSAKVLKRYLEVQGYDVEWCQNGLQALDVFQHEKFDLCILDILMPQKDGFAVAQEIRNRNTQIPILFLTVKSMTEDKIRAFKMGADDYITKPFSQEELSLRVQAVLKRVSHHYPQASEPNRLEDVLPNQIRIGKYLLDRQFQRLRLGDSERKLTARECDLLVFLYKRRNTVVKRELILQEIWGDDDYYKGRSLDVFISRARRYLSADKNVEIINIHGLGFKLVIREENENSQTFSPISNITG
ncbi:MAG: response regulator transcription factor [Cytophagales bacterium]|nr:response regulator transcription factor [Cytophagales bacterium]MDW8384437.1 response regulator transcription factor [Flammeovirgaceae bacterium]